jgi:hypothetical protein
LKISRGISAECDPLRRPRIMKGFNRLPRQAIIAGIGVRDQCLDPRVANLLETLVARGILVGGHGLEHPHRCSIGHERCGASCLEHYSGHSECPCERPYSRQQVTGRMHAFPPQRTLYRVAQNRSALHLQRLTKDSHTLYCSFALVSIPHLEGR